MTALKNKIKGLELLQPNHAGALIMDNGVTINYGVIRKNEVELVYYTSKGLREIWSPNGSAEIARSKELKNILNEGNAEAKLISSGHIKKIKLDDIERVIF